MAKGFYKSNTNNSKDKEVKYEIKDDLGTISSRSGYDLKLCLVSWNGNDPKYEFRTWKAEDGSPGRERHTFTGEEMETIYNILKKVMGD